MKPNADPAADAAGGSDDGAAAALLADDIGAGAPMDDCKNEKPLFGAAGAGTDDSSLESPFIERPPNMMLFVLLLEG